MEISQFSFVLLAVYSVCFGAILGVIYDIIRIQRVVLGAEYKSKIDYRNIELPLIKKKVYSVKFEKISRKILAVYIAIGDVIFVTLCGVAVVLVAYAYNSGRVRAIIFLGLLAGFLLYYFTIGKLVMGLAGLIGFILRSALVYLYEMIAAPLRLALRLVQRHKRGEDIKERERENDKREKQTLGS